MTSRFGRFEKDVVYRSLPGDEGPTLHVFGPTPSSDREEVLRFDCFRKAPHYHLAWSYRKEPFIPIEEEDSLGWSIAQLKNQANVLMEKAGALQMRPEEVNQLKDILPILEARGRDLCNPKRNGSDCLSTP